MPAVLVHGVPETTAIWEPLVRALSRDDVVTVALPGFGTPLPESFELTMHCYAQWLAEELATYDEVDLVAHDWGGLLALRVLADQPANVASWSVDVGDLDDGFRWHDQAKMLQSPEGEALMEGWLEATPEDSAALLEGLGAPADAARLMAEHLDATMGAAILGLYRSAVDIGTEWGPGIARISAPGLVIESGRDPFRAPRRAAALASRTGAKRLELPEAGHWWMVETPGPAAEALEAFWAGPR